MKIKFIVLLIILLEFSLNLGSSLSVSVNVPEKYSEVKAGERFYFEIQVKYPENPKRKDLRLEYEIVDREGELIAQSKVLKAVETQASFIDFIVIPSDIESGLYLINVKIKDYGKLSEEVGASFNIIGAGVDSLLLYSLIILTSIMAVGILVFVQISKLKKKK